MFCTSGKEMGAPTGNGMHDSARELTEMASTQFAFYGLMNPYTYQRPKITLLPNETGLTVPGGTRVAVVPNGTAPALNPPYLPGQYTEYPAAVQGWAQQALPGGGSGIESGSGSVKNWKGQEVKIPDGHIMSSRDPDFSEPPIYREGPYTDAQRNAFLQGKSGDTKIAPHHRHQIPVRDGGVIDEIPGPGHPEGNQHTGGSPNRHPNSSIFNSESNGNRLRNSEIRAFWKAKGKRLIPDGRGGWIDPRY